MQIPAGKLTFFSLMMINVIAVDSLRNLTVGAEYGYALVFFYLLGALLFFIPTILVAAELATGWPNTGGVYIWVREAFGPRSGFMTIWLQRVYNVVWYPTVFAFIAGIAAYLIDPALVNNKIYMLSIILITFWTATFLNFFGIKTSSILSAIGAIFGTLFPMILITVLGFAWVYKGHPSAIPFTVRNFFPNMSDLNNLAFLTNILFGLMGMEMSAVHAGDVGNPKKDYPKALLFSAIIILSTLVFSCLATAIVISVKDLNLVSGLMDAFAIFFKAFHLEIFIPVLAILIIIGSLSGAAAWIIGPARGLQVATEDSDLPKMLRYLNKKNMPTGILFLQGIIVTILSLVFLIMPSVNSSYWVLSNLTAQLALIFYIMMFAAAIRLRYKHAKVERAFKIPGGKWGIWLVGGIGIFTCVSAIILGFIPPTQIAIGKVASYEAILIFGIIIFCVPAFFIHKKKRIS